MEIKSKEQALELVIKAIPYPEQVSDWDLSSETTAIYFTWRKTNRFRFNYPYMSVDEVGNGVLIGSDISILLRKLLQLTLYKA